MSQENFSFCGCLQKAVVPAAGAASLPRAKRLIVGVSPASSLRMAVDHYVRQAEHVLPVRPHLDNCVRRVDS